MKRDKTHPFTPFKAAIGTVLDPRVDPNCRLLALVPLLSEGAEGRFCEIHDESKVPGRVGFVIGA